MSRVNYWKCDNCEALVINTHGHWHGTEWWCNECLDKERLRAQDTPEPGSEEYRDMMEALEEDHYEWLHDR